MIRVYPSRLEGEPIEIHETHEDTTLQQWLDANAPRCDVSHLTILKNGELADADTEFGPSDVLDLHIEPKGLMALGTAIAGFVFAAAIVALMPKPETPNSQRGKALGQSNLSANTARFGEPIPEILGAPPRIYPDYLVPPHTYYQAGNNKVQWVEALLCVGKGEFNISPAGVYIGDTRAVSLGSDVELEIYEPGQTINDRAREWWHNCDEVGFTSRGGAGMEVGRSSSITKNISANTLTVDGDLLIIPASDSATFPNNWDPGTELRLEVPYPVTVSGNRITTALGLAHFTPTAGMMVEITGADDGVYKVGGFAPATGGSPEVPGSPSSITADAAPARLDFATTPSSLTIHRGSNEHHFINLIEDFASVEALAQAIAWQINGLLLGVTVDNGAVKVYESTTYTGLPITVSGAAANDVFGFDPIEITGDATVPAIPAGNASITLLNPNDTPAQLTQGNQSMAIGNEGLRFNIIGDPNNKTRRIEMIGVPSFTGFQALTSTEIDVTLGSGSAAGGYTGPFAVVPEGEVCTGIEVDIVFPSGIQHTTNKGKLRWRDVNIVLEWRQIGSPTWTTVITRTIGGNQKDAMGYTFRYVPEAGRTIPPQPEIRMRRLEEVNPGKTVNMFQWTALRGRIASPNKYDGVTALAIRMRTGDRISSQADNKVWVKATRLLPTVANKNTLAATRDIVPAMLHVLDKVGYGRDRVNMVAAEELHAILSARNDYFDFAVKDASTVKTLVNHILKAGFSEMVVDRGLIKPVRDALRDQPEYIYSPQEFTDYPTILTKLLEPDEVDGVDAEFLDEATGRTATVKYRLAGDNGLRAQKINLIGVTNRTKAWRLAARHRRMLAYRRTIFKGETELQALNSSYMSYDRIQDGIPGYGQSAFVVHRVGNILTVSEEFDWGDGDGLERVIAFRRMDGRLTAAQTVTKGSSPYEVVLSAALPTALHFGGDSRDPTMVYFGVIGMWAHDVLITSIKPGKDNKVSIEAMEYDPRIYADDDNAPS